MELHYLLSTPSKFNQNTLHRWTLHFAGSLAAFPLPFLGGTSVMRAYCEPTNTKPLTCLVFTKQYFMMIGELQQNQAKK